MKYTFIHPTKSGGIAIDEYFTEHYREYISDSKLHKNKCTDTNNSIIVVRDVESRFLSMYKYWKYGSDRWKREKKELKNISLIDFINLLKTNKRKLYGGIIWNQHFDNTTDWINTDYKNIIVIRYSSNLNDKIQKLLQVLEIPNKYIPLPKTNVSRKIEDESDLHLQLNDPIVKEFISSYFKSDIELIETIRLHPERFKHVI
jgi:hypothetical protein